MGAPRFTGVYASTVHELVCNSTQPNAMQQSLQNAKVTQQRPAD